jgi:anti-sigma regulatory factor (Ser/Thr protein kinase)
MVEQEMTLGTMVLTAGSPLAVRAARHALQAQLEGWECTGVSAAVLVLSELATNAVQHAGGATRIHVVHGDQTVRLEVHDDTHDRPRVRDAAGPAGGFGLKIVSRLSESWGWDQTATGKVVWSTVRCCPGEPG